MRALARLVDPPARLAIAAASVLAVMSVLYKGGSLKAADEAARAFVGSVHNSGFDALGQLDDRVFDPAPAFAIALLLALTLWRIGPPWAWVAPGFIALSGFVDLVLRRGVVILLHPRELLSAAGELIGVHYHGLASFPSGHVERAAFLAVIALAYLPRWLSLPFTVLAASSLFARMYDGGHQLSDVIAGAALGTAVGGFAVWSVARVANMRKTQAR